jgi:hypothetical protein
VHLFKITPDLKADIQEKVAAELGLTISGDPSLSQIGQAVRLAMYKTGNYRLPEDHTNSDSWRTQAVDGKVTNSLNTKKRDATSKGGVIAGPDIPGL